MAMGTLTGVPFVSAIWDNAPLNNSRNCSIVLTRPLGYSVCLLFANGHIRDMHATVLKPFMRINQEIRSWPSLLQVRGSQGDIPASEHSGGPPGC